MLIEESQKDLLNTDKVPEPTAYTRKLRGALSS